MILDDLIRGALIAPEQQNPCDTATLATLPVATVATVATVAGSQAFPSVKAGGQTEPSEPKTAPPQGRVDREAKRRELERLIRLLAEHDPAHWSDDDIREALEAGEQDLASALATWRTICEQHGGATVH